MPRLNSIIPDFNADNIFTKQKISLHDYIKNSWAILFSCPMDPKDFTPVSTTELGRMALRFDEFKNRKVKLIALSCDDHDKLKNWVNDIQSHYSKIKGDFPFPIIGISRQDLTDKFDMLDEADKNNPDAALTVQALYVIDPSTILRWAMVYPTSTGCNVDELLRVIDSLQLIDKYNKIIATPADWKPGHHVMVVPSFSNEEVEKEFSKYEIKVEIKVAKLPSEESYLRIITNLHTPKNSCKTEPKK